MQLNLLLLQSAAKSNFFFKTQIEWAEVFQIFLPSLNWFKVTLNTVQATGTQLHHYQPLFGSMRSFVSGLLSFNVHFMSSDAYCAFSLCHCSMQQSTVLPSIFRLLESHHPDGSKRLIRFKIWIFPSWNGTFNKTWHKKVVQFCQLWIFPANTLAQKQILGHCLKEEQTDLKTELLRVRLSLI